MPNSVIVIVRSFSKTGNHIVRAYLLRVISSDFRLIVKSLQLLKGWRVTGFCRSDSPFTLEQSGRTSLVKGQNIWYH